MTEERYREINERADRVVKAYESLPDAEQEAFTRAAEGAAAARRLMERFLEKAEASA